MTVNCFSCQLEFDLNKLSDDEYNRMVENHKGQEFKISKKIGTCQYREIDKHFAVFSQESGSGMWVHDIYILVRMKKGGWEEIFHCSYSTAEPKKYPGKVRFENNVISVLTKEDRFLASFDVSDVLNSIKLRYNE